MKDKDERKRCSYCVYWTKTSIRAGICIANSSQCEVHNSEEQDYIISTPILTYVQNYCEHFLRKKLS